MPVNIMYYVTMKSLEKARHNNRKEKLQLFDDVSLSLLTVYNFDGSRVIILNIMTSIPTKKNHLNNLFVVLFRQLN